MTACCPACFRAQDAGLLCHSCCDRLEDELHDVPAVVAELHTTLAKQARMEGGKAGLASERSGYHEGASLAADYLGNTLTTWAREIAGDHWAADPGHETVIAAHALLSEIPAIRRHPAAAELHDEICSAVRQARAAIDRPANRTLFHVGPCPEDTDDGPCPGEVFAFFPTEDSRPPRMECRENPEHRWASHQWYRTGERILRRMRSRRRAA